MRGVKLGGKEVIRGKVGEIRRSKREVREVRGDVGRESRKMRENERRYVEGVRRKE